MAWPAVGLAPPAMVSASAFCDDLHSWANGGLMVENWGGVDCLYSAGSPGNNRQLGRSDAEGLTGNCLTRPPNRACARLSPCVGVLWLQTACNGCKMSRPATVSTTAL